MAAGGSEESKKKTIQTTGTGVGSSLNTPLAESLSQSANVEMPPEAAAAVSKAIEEAVASATESAGGQSSTVSTKGAGTPAPAARQLGGAVQHPGGQRVGHKPNEKSRKLDKRATDKRSESRQHQSKAADHKNKADASRNDLKWAGMSEDQAKQEDAKSGLTDYHGKQWREAKEKREAEMAGTGQSPEAWKQSKEAEASENENQAEQEQEAADLASKEANEASRASQQASEVPVDALGRETGAVPAVAGGAGAALPGGAVGGEAAMASMLREAQMKQRVADSRNLPQMPSGGGIGGGAGGMASDPLGNMMGGEEEEGEEEEEMGTARATASQAQHLKVKQMASKLLAHQTGMGEEEMRDKVRAEIRDAATAAAKQAIRNGLEWLANFCGVSLDTSTAGISTVVNVFMYALTLGDWNMQMIWGYYITKKKSFFFPPLEWKPLPVPLPDIWLHAMLVGLDIAIFLVLITVAVAVFLVTFGPYILAGLAWGGILYMGYDLLSSFI